jgi:membrane protein implicated in regulation of membrane protease activity
MTKKNLSISLGIIILMIILLNPGFIEALLMFLFIGALPGTTFSLPPLVMLAILSSAIILLTHYVALRQVRSISAKVTKKRHTIRKTAQRRVTKAAPAKIPQARRRRFSNLEA